jgi:outer membrane lipoprotein-sorting protein
MKYIFAAAAVLVTSLVLVPIATAQEKLKAEEIVEKHLAAVASTEKRSGIRSIVAAGEVRVENIAQKNQQGVGRFVMASEGPKMYIGMRLNAADYQQEKMVFDGQKLDVAMAQGSRSLLGSFIHSNSGVLSNGLFSGVLSTGWILSGAAQRGAKITAAGIKKVDGKEAYVLRVTPKGSNDLDISMFFDQQTFQHIRTEYRRGVSANIGVTVDDSARQSETRLKVTEEFSDHKEYQGVVFPTKYRIHYSITNSQRGTIEVAWTANLSEFAINQALDPTTFAISK